MSIPKPIFSRPGDGVVIDITRHERNYLVYTDPQGTKHSMCWENERWYTACRIALGLGAERYAPGRLVSHIDLRDIFMSIPTCMLCICAEEGRKPP